ncbi:MAG TPA: TetR/AcrR family transcriptional regulator [Oscillospiraceae bacterium]|nr:TetR/AcrR family transcriptional regulator [Oscillospiraceae bacterium]
MNKREQQRLERREQIINCSLDMIISRGYESMKIRDLAEQLNISTGLFFNYFESKEQIYEELVKIAISGTQHVLTFNPEGIRPIELFEKITQAIFESLKSNSRTAKMFILMAQACESKAVPESVKELVSRFDAVTPMVPIVKMGQQLGEIKEGDPAALLVAYWGSIQGIAESYAIKPNLPLPQSSWIVDILRK